MKLTDK